MDSAKYPAMQRVTKDLPRRKAIQGAAGSLAGLAALGAISASAKKKKKGSKKGTLNRFESAAETDSIPTTVANSTTTLSVDCPVANNNETVFATGGGFDTTEGVPPTIIATASQANSAGDGWEVTFFNQGPPVDATVSVVCAYFKTK